MRSTGSDSTGAPSAGTTTARSPAPSAEAAATCCSVATTTGASSAPATAAASACSVPVPARPADTTACTTAVSPSSPGPALDCSAASAISPAASDGSGSTARPAASAQVGGVVDQPSPSATARLVATTSEVWPSSAPSASTVAPARVAQDTSSGTQICGWVPRSLPARTPEVCSGGSVRTSATAHRSPPIGIGPASWSRTSAPISGTTVTRTAASTRQASASAARVAAPDGRVTTHATAASARTVTTATATGRPRRRGGVDCACRVGVWRPIGEVSWLRGSRTARLSRTLGGIGPIAPPVTRTEDAPAWGVATSCHAPGTVRLRQSPAAPAGWDRCGTPPARPGRRSGDPGAPPARWSSRPAAAPRWSAAGRW
ncbi:unannotated protein [freshwater metagenome]|uniref:Unannotated protein n=1 Tax=freshwater metagenome TaxID=449393 RepID=A0A6J7I0X8_9ZZZZ